jgi:hypothetical protein
MTKPLRHAQEEHGGDGQRTGIGEWRGNPAPRIERLMLGCAEFDQSLKGLALHGS